MQAPLRLAAATALMCSASVALAAPHAARDSIAAAERAFSALSVAQGMKPAFLAFLAPDGVVFTPLATNGQKRWEARRAPLGTLIWEPEYAEASAAGDLGWDMGPWEYRPAPDSTGKIAEDQIGHGHFHSVWERQPDGRYLVVADIGGDHDKPARGVGSGDFVAGPGHTGRAGLRNAALTSLKSVAGEFAERSAKRGTPAALATYGAADVRWSRSGHLPAHGLAAAKAAAVDSGTTRWLPQDTRVAESGDLGYAYGVAERLRPGGATPDTSAFLQVWRREGAKWKLALAVVNPVPK